MISLFGMLFFLLFFYKKTTTERLSFFCYPLQLFLAIGHSCAVILCILWAFFFYLCYGFIYCTNLIRKRKLHDERKKESVRDIGKEQKRVRKSEKDWVRFEEIEEKIEIKHINCTRKIRCKNKKITWNSCLLQFNAMKCITALSP